MDICVGLLP